MKKIHILTIAIFCLSLLSLSIQPAAMSANDEQTLRRLNEERDRALERNDTAALARIMSDDYATINPFGELRTKAQVLADIKSGAVKNTAFKSSDVQVRLYGNAAVLTGQVKRQAVDHERTADGQFRFMRVYVKRNGQWQNVANQMTKIAQ